MKSLLVLCFIAALSVGAEMGTPEGSGRGSGARSQWARQGQAGARGGSPAGGDTPGDDGYSAVSVHVEMNQPVSAFVYNYEYGGGPPVSTLPGQLGTQGQAKSQGQGRQGFGLQQRQ